MIDEANRDLCYRVRYDLIGASTLPHPGPVAECCISRGNALLYRSIMSTIPFLPQVIGPCGDICGGGSPDAPWWITTRIDANAIRDLVEQREVWLRHWFPGQVNLFQGKQPQAIRSRIGKNPGNDHRWLSLSCKLTRSITSRFFVAAHHIR